MTRSCPSSSPITRCYLATTSRTPQCKPSGCLSTDWEHDKLAGNGSYTHFAVALKDGAEAVRIIRNGMGADRHIWLAGEHAAPDIALSTIVGAYWRGEGVARKILRKEGLWEVSGQVQLAYFPRNPPLKNYQVSGLSEAFITAMSFHI